MVKQGGMSRPVFVEKGLNIDSRVWCDVLATHVFPQLIEWFHNNPAFSSSTGHPLM